MNDEIPTQYDPVAVEQPIYQRWLAARAFAARPTEDRPRYVIMMPLPNVTGALHMGHAMDNVMQDLLIRWRRMKGDDALWMPGTDHAGIATQAVVEKRLFELEGKTRHDIGRAALVARIWEWKDQYQARIVRQQQAMGCSCDWERQRFTLDEVCARAVRHTFSRMFADGLIYRGKRLVNWDCHLETAVSDDEIYHETVPGHFWHLRYPVIDPAPGEPTQVIVATTRPETMLGDTAVAVHPDPAAALARVTDEARARLAAASPKERAEQAEEVARLEARATSHLPRLLRLAAMAGDGRKLRLPLQEREIPLILDSWAKPELGSGCVKITPAHDPNDYEVWSRHREEIGIINLLETTGRLSAAAGAYAGLDRFVARKRVVADLEAKGLIEAIEDRMIEIGHSDRSKTPVEPYLSDQWFVRMQDVPGGVVMGRGTKLEHRAAGLAQAAIDAVAGAWRSPTGRKLTFHPDGDRYASTFLRWLEEKRDWCIGRQLWWGHRVPIWRRRITADQLSAALIKELDSPPQSIVRIGLEDGSVIAIEKARALPPKTQIDLMVCLLDTIAEDRQRTALDALGLVQEEDVLDTWFSSALWPHSTLGWPEASVPPETGDTVSRYYPGSCLVTGREIITLWVARMVITGLYNLGDLPFTDCFLHANIQDGQGKKMSKTAGNGIDPVDIIERYGTDSLRYVIADLQTGSQDIRLPVSAISPYTGELIDLAAAKHGSTRFTYIDPTSGKEFDVLGTMADVPAAKLISDRFEVGRNFCNKLWNAARFATMNLAGSDATTEFTPRENSELTLEDRWILSRLSRTIRAVDSHLAAYNPSLALAQVRDFFWNEFCDWYLELVKPRMADPDRAALARQVLGAVLDQSLRLMHPFIPFITEAIWENLGRLAPARGIDFAFACKGLLILAPWPETRPEWEDDALEAQIAFAQDLIRSIRDIRGKYGVPPRQPIKVRIKATPERESELNCVRHLIERMAVVEDLQIGATMAATRDAAAAVVRDVEAYVLGVIDLDKERARLHKQRDSLEGRIKGIESKLANPGFIEKAKPEVIDRERQRLGELQSELTSLLESIARLA